MMCCNKISKKNWIEILTRNYYIFKVPPYHKRIQRALKKEAKYYLWDWSEIKGEGERFENMLAGHLLKFCHFYQDVYGIAVELFYLRDLEKRKVDFLIVWEGKSWILVESKLASGAGLTSLNYFARKTKVELGFVVVKQKGVDYIDPHSKIRTISADRFLLGLI
ncbi:DUF4143 domain-containing protein [bacterium]|nr:DUF4143 domain-containing protein [bacterium]